MIENLKKTTDYKTEILTNFKFLFLQKNWHVSLECKKCYQCGTSTDLLIPMQKKPRTYLS